MLEAIYFHLWASPSSMLRGCSYSIARSVPLPSPAVSLVAFKASECLEPGIYITIYNLYNIYLPGFHKPSNTRI